MNKFYSIKENIYYEIEEKKSKFLTHIIYIENEIQAKEELEKIRKKYKDARHNCFAYRVVADKKITERASDDGEPSGTAGAPMLNILQKNNLCNVLVVVTRYFGGILLGTGGLIRAYQNSILDAIKNVELIFFEEGYEALVKILYKDIEKFKYYCKINNIRIIDVKYDELISNIIEINNNQKNNLLIKTNDVTDFEYKILKSKYIIGIGKNLQ